MEPIVCKGGANSSFIIFPHVDRLHLGHEAYRVTNRYQGRMLEVPKVEYHILMLLEFHKILLEAKQVSLLVYRYSSNCFIWRKSLLLNVDSEGSTLCWKFFKDGDAA